MEEGYYVDLTQALHDLADEWDAEAVQRGSDRKTLRRCARSVRKLAGIDTRQED